MDRESSESLYSHTAVCSVDLSYVSVIIPTLNEAEGLPRVIEELLGIGVPRERIFVVDGGSTDGSPEIAMKYGVKVIPQNGRGKAGAIRTGLEHVETPYVAIMDGDYTYPASELPKMLCMARNYSIVVGRRIPLKGSMNLIYRLGNKLITTWFNILFGTRLGDVLSGMYVAQSDRLREVSFEMEGFSVESEILAHMVSMYGDVGEHPIPYRRRVGRKKLRAYHGLLIALDIMRLTWRYNPAFFIALMGSILLIPGLILGAWVGYYYFFEGVAFYVKGVIAVIMSLVGFLSLLMAVMALYLKRFEMRIMRAMKRILEDARRRGPRG
jgi:dolichol-phosphate mannosyltransferase